MRKAAFAGYFYPSSASKIKKIFSEWFCKEEKNALAIIAPHAGYEYSGKVAARAYSSLANAETFVIIGVNHSNIGNAISTEDFETPLGIVKNNKELAKKISKLGGIEINESMHEREHSIEVQLPFLLFSKKNFNFIPIILSNYDYAFCKALAIAIFKASEEKKIAVIASSDFTHYGYSYGFVLDGDSKQNIYNIDKNAIKEILNFDAKAFLEKASRTTICGAGAIATVIEAAKLLGAKKTSLLEYCTSGDVVHDYDNAVGYAAISFY